MIITVVTINRTLWRRLYKIAEERYQDGMNKATMSNVTNALMTNEQGNTEGLMAIDITQTTNQRQATVPLLELQNVTR